MEGKEEEEVEDWEILRALWILYKSIVSGSLERRSVRRSVAKMETGDGKVCV